MMTNRQAEAIAEARRRWPHLFMLAEKEMLRRYGPRPLCINGAEYHRRRKGRRR